jgi:hypothetical protein
MVVNLGWNAREGLTNRSAGRWDMFRVVMGISLNLQ